MSAREFTTHTPQDPPAAELKSPTELDFHTLANSIPQLAWMADATGYIFCKPALV